MRVLFTTIAGTGHFYPLLPYAHEMMRRGFDVRVGAADTMAGQIAAAGLVHAPIGHPPQEEVDAFFAGLAHLAPHEIGPFVQSGFFADMLPRHAIPALRQLVEDWRPDLIVREAGEYGGALVSALSGVPHVRVSVSNGHSLTGAIPAIDRLREELGLAADRGAALRAARAFSSFPVSLEPQGADGALLPQVRVAPGTELPSETPPDWLGEGDHPQVYMTFGTVMGSSDKAKAVFRAALDAVAERPVSVMMTTGPEMDVDALGVIPANVTLRSFVPQKDVFPHVDAVVCHGGSGTILGALAASLPLVVVPIGADQPENAQSVAAAGAGIAVDTESAIDATRMAQALDDVLMDPGYRAGARRIAQEMHDSPDVAAAVDKMITCARINAPTVPMATA